MTIMTQLFTYFQLNGQIHVKSHTHEDVNLEASSKNNINLVKNFGASSWINCILYDRSINALTASTLEIAATNGKIKTIKQ